ncbi:nucleotidyltransferase family protein [Evansella sp. AB-P1]|uniref:nucleotidyltransferase family protein n=1 Tax=Evansella sp. AB-P1 TaxID=3037653 RepID=UPI00241E577D|nr:nucleotidyltransferase family protein [Evansella sp. AB-P1]MDG5787911.1 nucleotidyltransferase family protein [Evansella sp. AB-P1]
MVKHTVSAVILAAGMSRRMGCTKQLMKLGDSFILERVIKNVMSLPFEEIVIVVGHQKEKIKREISIHSSIIKWVYNEKYEKGQSSSFLTGMEFVPSSSSSVMFFLGDQPFIQRNSMLTVFETGIKGMKKQSDPFVVRPYFQKTPGHPIFFGNYKQLDFSNVSGDHGGKALLKNVNKMVNIYMNDPHIAFDIDTPEDFEKAKWMIKNMDA